MGREGMPRHATHPAPQGNVVMGIPPRREWSLPTYAAVFLTSGRSGAAGLVPASTGIALAR